MANIWWIIKKQESFRKTSTFALGGSDGKASDYNAGDPGSIPGLGRSPGEGNGNPLQNYCLENPMDRGAMVGYSPWGLRVGHDWATSLFLSLSLFPFALLTMPKTLAVWITIHCGKFWRRWEYQTAWWASWEICIQVRKQQLELDMEQQTGSR